MNITDPAVANDYVRVVTNGESPSTVARDRGITGSTVSANVARIRRAIDAGDAITVNGSTWDPGTATVSGDNAVNVMSLGAWCASDASPFDGDNASVIARVMDAVDAGTRDIMSTIDALTTRIDNASRDRDTSIATLNARRSVFDAAMPDGVTVDDVMNAYDAYVADATAGTPDDATPDGDTATDATPDASPDGDTASPDDGADA